jgi:threonine dehydrogenase-like Zn-dependent dehydrogenase
VTGGYAERGIKSLDGFLRRYVVEEAQHLVRVPAALSGVGVLVEPLTIATKAAEQARALLARITWRPTRPRGLVLGAGPVGLLGAMAMIAHGLDTFVYSRESPTDECARLSESIGAVYISAAETSAKRLAERVGEVELIFEAAGVSKLAFEAFWALAPNSTCVLTGIPAIGHSADFEIDRLMRSLVLRNQTLVGAVNAGRQAYTSAVDLLTKFMALFPDAVRRLVGELHPLAHAPALLHKRAGIKDVVAP